jgi:murein L,D-transpeptidase YafK
MALPSKPGGCTESALRRKTASAVAAVVLTTGLAGCHDKAPPEVQAKPLSAETLNLMAVKGVGRNSPMLIRSYKMESEFEVWKMRPDGTYVLLKTYPICRWSGQLGPKRKEGDRQAPEGFYSIAPSQMNPNSAYYLSFNIGYPNAYDRAHGATGGALMVHGICSSSGCFSMTDAQIAEIYVMAREAFDAGQRAIQMQSFPFHMTAQNLAQYRLDPNMPFWRELKDGDTHFEATKRDVDVSVCARRYFFDVKPVNGQPLAPDSSCPPLMMDASVAALVGQRERTEDAAEAALVAKGVRPVRLVYQDGGQHPSFARRIQDVSRPETLVPPVEIAVEAPAAKGR